MTALNKTKYCKVKLRTEMTVNLRTEVTIRKLTVTSVRKLTCPYSTQ